MSTEPAGVMTWGEVIGRDKMEDRLADTLTSRLLRPRCRRRCAPIKRLAEASAGLDAHLKTWAPDFRDNFINSDQVSILAGALMAREELEYALVIALNEVIYIDDELTGENCSRVTIAQEDAVPVEPQRQRDRQCMWPPVAGTMSGRSSCTD